MSPSLVAYLRTIYSLNRDRMPALQPPALSFNANPPSIPLTTTDLDRVLSLNTDYVLPLSTAIVSQLPVHFLNNLDCPQLVRNLLTSIACLPSLDLIYYSHTPIPVPAAVCSPSATFDNEVGSYRRASDYAHCSPPTINIDISRNARSGLNVPRSTSTSLPSPPNAPLSTSIACHSRRGYPNSFLSTTPCLPPSTASHSTQSVAFHTQAILHDVWVPASLTLTVANWLLP
ncbi:hypothetical protein BDY19DRAFT_994590 [Irpex rosettiformis]|uniref:Uncharacterized protein n=1 Tax=Irpex rosettiformis TaxID=378272 RepID=A0ACB8U027_9APHY|nr:hypothetical protein BDY19DRAFT_994590 [Irpex rosettiformis]